MLRMIFRFVKRVINTIKLEASMSKAENGPEPQLYASRDMVNSEGYILIHNHKAVRRERKVISTIKQVDLGGIEPTPVVLVDDDFYKLSKSARRVVIEHELAHFTLHACESDSPEIDATDEDELRKDREADAEVFHVLHDDENDIVSALREARDIIGTKEYINYYNIRIECIKRYARSHRRKTMRYDDLRNAVKVDVVYTYRPDQVVVY